MIRLTEFSETSQIVSLFTAEAGQVRLIAKGSRRGTKTRVATGLDLLELGELSYAPARRHAGLGTLAEWVQRGTFPGLRREMLRLYCGLYAAELVGALTEQDAVCLPPNSRSTIPSARSFLMSASASVKRA